MKTGAQGDFEQLWRKRFERYAGLHDNDAGIAGWSEGGLLARYRRFVQEWEAAEEVARGRWLDAGCGAGTYTRYLVGAGLTVTAVDYSLPTAEKARARVGDVAAWAAADVTQLPFSNGCFDGALCFGVMQALASRDRALRELRRVLRPGGVLWIDALNALCLPSLLSETWRQLRRRPRHLRYDAPRTFRKALRDNGFVEVQMHWVPILPSRLRTLQPLFESGLARRLLRVLPAAGEAASHSVLFRAIAA